MSNNPNRLAHGGFIDRSKPLTFSFDGKTYTGYQGDTLASALMANGVKLVGRSFKYHRPRGIFSAGAEEPNAMVHLRSGARQEPNTRATVVELYEGLTAESQNRGNSLRYDPQRFNDLFKNFIPAGFYYKTFMGPFRNTKIWMFFEKIIRKAAGMGTASLQTDPDGYDHMSRHCEVLVIGAGPAGLMAAKSAAASGARVILVDERKAPGGQLRFERCEVDGKPAADWITQTVAELENMENVFILTRTTAFGYYDQNFIGCVERVCDHLPEPEHHKPRQRMWNIQARQVVLATGSHEQPMVFGNNDRPNIMLAGAVRAYINGYGVLPGKRAVIFTSCDDAYRTAIDLVDAGAAVEAVVDSRLDNSAYAQQVRERNIEILQGCAIVNAHGKTDGVTAVDVQSLSGGGESKRIQCDLVAMSNGWAPALHLFSQSGGKTRWDDDRYIFVPGDSKQAECSIGAAHGIFSLRCCLEEGAKAGAEAATSAGFSAGLPVAPAAESLEETPYRPLWETPDPKSGHPKKFVDNQNDVASSDVKLAHREGYMSVEHLKRYTTLGMGTDQGKLSNVAGLAIMADARGCSIPEAGHTTFRPPYTPVSMGALGGAEVGEHYMPIRRTAVDSWHEEQGCKWVDAGIWRRPRCYSKPGETVRDTYLRETAATRGSVGMCDVTTLGKIDLQGPDTAEFLERIYINHWMKLPVGKVRYGMMLREDGIAYDDGTTSRLAENHFVMTTTTANAVKVMANLEFYLQAIWPDMRVKVTSVTEQWCAIAVAGPNSRKVLQKVVDIDISNEAFPFMGASECVAACIKCRLFRISFSGELAFELNVPCDYGRYVWEKIYEAGQEFNIVPYGTETLGNMRIEKGHVAGPELDGRTTADDVGLGMMMSKKKEFVGKCLASREHLAAPDRKKFVGFVPLDGKTPLKAGSQIVRDAQATPPVEMLGHITSTGYCVEKDHPIALGFIKGGLDTWKDKTVYMSYPLRNHTVPMKVVHQVFVDPEGERLRG